jgi:DNA mismatch repair ATPase MutS
VAPFETIASSFDRQLAKELSTIQPSPGVSSEYDQAKTAKEAVMDEFSKHLTSVREIFKSNRVEYTKVGKDEFVLEMPKEVAAKVKVSSDYKETKGTAKVARYQSTFVLKNLFRYKEAEEELQRCEKNVLSAYLRQLDSHRVIFSAVVHCLAQLDSLASLSKLSFTSDGTFVDQLAIFHVCTHTFPTTSSDRILPPNFSRSS